jgi:hypothetical protein
VAVPLGLATDVLFISAEQSLYSDVPSNKPIKENPMIRVPSLLFAAVLMTSASAFAADTPDPNQKGEPILPSGSNEGNPTAPKSTDATVDKNDNSTPVTTPGEESKGKPKIAPQ